MRSTPSERRPSVLWFVVGAVLMLVAAAAFAGGLFWTIRSSGGTDAVLTADGMPVAVSAPAGQRRMVYVVDGAAAATCTVADGTGLPRTPHPATGRTRVTTRGEQWIGVATFDSGDGRLTVACFAADRGQVRIGDPLGAAFVGRLLATILVPLLVGGLGLVILIVTSIRFATRPRPA